MQEQNKIEQLMRPRYKLIADYPGCSFEVGTILEPNDEGELYSKVGGYSWTAVRILEKDVKKFPHLVKRIEWYEERSLDEMPDYVVRNFEVYSGGLVGDPDILKVAEHFKSGRGEKTVHNQSFDTFTSENGLARSYSYMGFLPCTHADYLAQPSPQNQEEKK